ncbi:MAG: hypothetical protein AB7S38_12895 [Vulcanimicrobiota bacterium]
MSYDRRLLSFLGFDKGLEEARLEGLRESRQTIVAILQSRFEAVPATVEERLEGVSDPGRLRELAVTAANAGSVDGFLSAFQQP